MAITAGGQTIFNFGNIFMGGGSSFGGNSLVQPGQSSGSCGNDGTWFSPECQEEGGPGACGQGSPWGGFGGVGGYPGGFGGGWGQQGAGHGCGQGYAGGFPGGWDRRSPWGGQQPPWEQNQWGPQGANDQHCGWGTGRPGMDPRNPFARRYEQWEQRHGMQNGCQPPQQSDPGGCDQPKNPLQAQSLAGTSVWGDPHITSPNGKQQQFATPNALLVNGNGSAVLVQSPGDNKEATSASAYKPGQWSSISSDPNKTDVYENLNGLLRDLGTAQSLGIGEDDDATGQSIGTDPFQLGDNTSATFNKGTLNFAQA
ncbi:MAG TPA: hypothetical protein VGO93_19330 [Candidatus Xenobia bacterium]|jgi:hypothetical protein